MARIAPRLVYGADMAEPVLIEPGGGEAIVDDDRRRVAILADLAELAVTESRYAPGSGFGEHLRAARDDRAPAVDFDSDDPPPDGGLPASQAIVRGPGEGEELAVGPAHALFKAESRDGGGRFSLAETTLPPGFAGPPPHRHETFADSFYILEGTLTLRVGGETRAAGPGTFALAPPGTVHTFANAGEEPVRELNLMAPAGFERYLAEVARLSADGPPDSARLAEAAARHDFHLAG